MKSIKKYDVIQLTKKWSHNYSKKLIIVLHAEEIVNNHCQYVTGFIDGKRIEHFSINISDYAKEFCPISSID